MKKLYWRMYQDKHKTIYGLSVVVAQREMLAEIKAYFDDPADDDPPVFEPVMMTEAEFEELPGFNGF
ncbi:MAG: hypothetical protein KKF30_07505 [Proteobacteria bacterium]|nr:hypothetical protein [Pseudomonadota bacterium]MBU4470286.1 hypothetical protein [Pseudomonadota bacterium]MCG2752699.1 hypothetical protein [Desulfobacteraceae bacterium]